MLQRQTYPSFIVLLAIVLASCFPAAKSFSPHHKSWFSSASSSTEHAFTHQSCRRRLSRHSLLRRRNAASSNEEESAEPDDATNINDSSSSSSSWMDALKARQRELSQETEERSSRWRKAQCSSGVAISLPDWVRRLDVDYPLVACGSAAGNVYVAHLETGNIVASSNIASPEMGKDYNEDDDEDSRQTNDSFRKIQERTIRLLYGMYDGGGTIAIAFAGTLVCEARRSGGVHLWRLDTAPSTTSTPTAAGGTSNKQLISQGQILSLTNTLVTCLALDEDYLWVGTANGQIKAYSLDDELPLALQSKPELEWKVTSTVLSLSLCPDLNCAVVTTEFGSIDLLSTERPGAPIGSIYPPFDAGSRRAANVHALSAVFVTTQSTPNKKEYSIACGGNDGSLYIQPLKMKIDSDDSENDDDDDNFDDDDLDLDRPFDGKALRQFSPRHLGPLKCLASPEPGLLISAGHDGSMRVWDVAQRLCLYQFVGYKVWLGSLWTDGMRIVSDGADNTVIMHNFEKAPAKPESQ